MSSAKRSHSKKSTKVSSSKSRASRSKDITIKDLAGEAAKVGMRLAIGAEPIDESASIPREPTLTTSITDLEKTHENLRERAAAEARNLAIESARLDTLEARRG